MAEAVRKCARTYPYDITMQRVNRLAFYRATHKKRGTSFSLDPQTIDFNRAVDPIQDPPEFTDEDLAQHKMRYNHMGFLQYIVEPSDPRSRQSSVEVRIPSVSSGAGPSQMAIRGPPRPPGAYVEDIQEENEENCCDQNIRCHSFDPGWSTFQIYLSL